MVRHPRSGRSCGNYWLQPAYTTQTFIVLMHLQNNHIYSVILGIGAAHAGAPIMYDLCGKSISISKKRHAIGDAPNPKHLTNS